MTNGERVSTQNLKLEVASLANYARDLKIRLSQQNLNFENAALKYVYYNLPKM